MPHGIDDVMNQNDSSPLLENGLSAEFVSLLYHIDQNRDVSWSKRYRQGGKFKSVLDGYQRVDDIVGKPIRNAYSSLTKSVNDRVPQVGRVVKTIRGGAGSVAGFINSTPSSLARSSRERKMQESGEYIESNRVLENPLSDSIPISAASSLLLTLIGLPVPGLAKAILNTLGTGFAVWGTVAPTRAKISDIQSRHDIALGTSIINSSDRDFISGYIALSSSLPRNPQFLESVVQDILSNLSLATSMKKVSDIFLLLAGSCVQFTNVLPLLPEGATGIRYSRAVLGAIFQAFAVVTAGSVWSYTSNKLSAHSLSIISRVLSLIGSIGHDANVAGERTLSFEELSEFIRVLPRDIQHDTLSAIMLLVSAKRVTLENVPTNLRSNDDLSNTRSHEELVNQIFHKIHTHEVSVAGRTMNVSRNAVSISIDALRGAMIAMTVLPGMFWAGGVAKHVANGLPIDEATNKAGQTLCGYLGDCSSMFHDTTFIGSINNVVCAIVHDLSSMLKMKHEGAGINWWFSASYISMYIGTSSVGMLTNENIATNMFPSMTKEGLANLASTGLILSMLIVSVTGLLSARGTNREVQKFSLDELRALYDQLKECFELDDNLVSNNELSADQRNAISYLQTIFANGNAPCASQNEIMARFRIAFEPSIQRVKEFSSYLNESVDLFNKMQSDIAKTVGKMMPYIDLPKIAVDYLRERDVDLNDRSSVNSAMESFHKLFPPIIDRGVSNSIVDVIENDATQLESDVMWTSAAEDVRISMKKSDADVDAIRSKASCGQKLSIEDLSTLYRYNRSLVEDKVSEIQRGYREQMEHFVRRGKSLEKSLAGQSLGQSFVQSELSRTRNASGVSIS